MRDYVKDFFSMTQKYFYIQNNDINRVMRKENKLDKCRKYYKFLYCICAIAKIKSIYIRTKIIYIKDYLKLHYMKILDEKKKKISFRLNFHVKSFPSRLYYGNACPKCEIFCIYLVHREETASYVSVSIR